MEKIHVCPTVHTVLLQFNKSLFVLYNATPESVNCSLKSGKTFLQLDLQKKNFVKQIENFPQHLSEKFIGDDSSL